LLVSGGSLASAETYSTSRQDKLVYPQHFWVVTVTVMVPKLLNPGKCASKPNVDKIKHNRQTFALGTSFLGAQ